VLIGTTSQKPSRLLDHQRGRDLFLDLEDPGRSGHPPADLNITLAYASPMRTR